LVEAAVNKIKSRSLIKHKKIDMQQMCSRLLLLYQWPS
jgi:hypothetical protein